MSAVDMLDLLRRRLAQEGQPLAGPISIAELHRRLLPYHVCRAELGFATKAEYDVAMLRFLTGAEVRLQEAELGEALRRELASPEPGLAVLQRFAASEIRLPPAQGPAAEPSERAAGGPAAGPLRKGVAAAAEPAGGSPPETGGPAAKGPAAKGPAAGGPAGPLRKGAGSGAAAGAAAGAGSVGARGAAASQPEAAEAVPRAGAGPETKRPRSAGGPAVTGAAEPSIGAGSANGSEALTAEASRRAGSGGVPAAGACAGCERPLPDRPGVRFCPHCGRDQRLRECLGCGAEMEPEWSFCVVCGAGRTEAG